MLFSRRKDGDKLQHELTEISSHAPSREESGDEGRTLWQNVKKYRKVVWITLGMTSAILLYGYDNVIVGTVSAMPGFQCVFLCRRTGGRG